MTRVQAAQIVDVVLGAIAETIGESMSTDEIDEVRDRAVEALLETELEEA